MGRFASHSLVEYALADDEAAGPKSIIEGSIIGVLIYSKYIYINQVGHYGSLQGWIVLVHVPEGLAFLEKYALREALERRQCSPRSSVS